MRMDQNELTSYFMNIIQHTYNHKPTHCMRVKMKRSTCTDVECYLLVQILCRFLNLSVFPTSLCITKSVLNNPPPLRRKHNYATNHNNTSNTTTNNNRLSPKQCIIHRSTNSEIAVSIRVKHTLSRRCNKSSQRNKKNRQYLTRSILYQWTN
mmetsp:Transcript_10415/g.21928  ORF Transcript_10415/g.21928 Transcript_10415/m.21928 type:complete len:152 (-) Transcript_10415:1103-1558(-)